MLYLSTPTSYILELTPFCNNRCVGCGNVYAHPTAALMSLADWRAIIAGFAVGVSQITLSGGEPTLHPHFFDILESTMAYDVPISVFTNGRWKNPQEVVRRFQKFPGLAGLLISLHGATAASHEAFTQSKGSFSETLCNIELATQCGIPVVLSSIITHHSWSEVEQIVALAQRIGVHRVTFPRYIGPPLPGMEPTAEELKTAVSQIEALMDSGASVDHGICIPQCFTSNASTGCAAGVAYVAIDPWGNVRPCNFSPTIIGSLHIHSMYDLWHSDKMNVWRALMPTECTTCAAYAVCHGGCRAVQELRSDGHDPLRGELLTEYTPPQEIRELPASVQPLPNFRIREEDFGYALMGNGQVIPVAREALVVLNACDGNVSFAELAAQFGQPGLDLLGELWELGMLDPA